MSKKKKRGKEKQTEVKKDTHDRIYDDAISYLKDFKNVFVVVHSNPNIYVSHEIRHFWKPSRFLFGKIEVLRKGLHAGFVGPDTRKEDFNHFVLCLKGQSGLFFSNKPKQEVLDWFNNYSEEMYAKLGDKATKNVVLSKGPHPEISRKLAGQLKKEWGIPLTLEEDGVVVLRDHEVCRQGFPLSRQQCGALKTLRMPMITKTFCVLGSYNNEEGFESY